MHQPEKNPPHQKAEAGERDHRSRLKVVVPGARFDLPAFIHSPALKQFTETAARFGRFQHVLKPIQPFWKSAVGSSQHWLQYLSHVCLINIRVIQTRRRTMGEKLDEEKIYFVPMLASVLATAQVVLEQGLQVLITDQRRGLQKLPQLMDCDALVQAGKPLARRL